MTHIPIWEKADRGILWSMLAVALVYLATLSLLPKHGLWMVDNENRYLQIQALVDSGFSEYIIRWPGKSIDPSYEFRPLRFDPEGSYFQEKNGNLISVFQPAFILISAFSFRAFGWWGLYLVPLLSALLMLIGASRIASLLQLGAIGGSLTVLVVGLCTPVWFYSQVLWEHTAAACLCIWGTYYCLRFLNRNTLSDLVRGLTLLAFALFFRDVLILFYLVIIGLLCFKVRDGWVRILVTGGIILVFAFAALMLFQWAIIDRPTGFHVETLITSTSGITDFLKDRLLLAYMFLVASDSKWWWSIVLASPFLLAFVLRPKLNKEQFLRYVPIAAMLSLITGSMFLVGFFRAESFLHHLLAVNSFFLASPVLILAFFRRRFNSGDNSNPLLSDFLLSAACLYLLIYTLTAPKRGAVSMHWACRPVFTLYPIFAVLSTATLVRWFKSTRRKIDWRAIAICLILLLSFVDQAFSIKLLNQKKDFSDRLNKTVHQFSEAVVVTNSWWAGHELYGNFFDRSIFYVPDQTHFDQLVGKLRQHGVRDVLFVARTKPGKSVPNAVRISDGELNFYALDVFVLKLTR